MNRRLHSVLPSVAAVCALICTTASASVVVPLSLAEMSEAATVIVDARVIAVHTSDETGRIERVVTLRVLSRWKGASADIVHVRLPGGTLGRTRTIVSGVPTLDEGDRFVLFLDEAARGGFRILGLYQGAWRVTGGGPDNPLAVGPAPVNASRVGPLTRGDGARRPRSLHQFRADVQTLAAGRR